MVRTRLSSVCPIQVRFTRSNTSDQFLLEPPMSRFALPRAAETTSDECLCRRFLTLLTFALTSKAEIAVNMSLNRLRADQVRSQLKKSSIDPLLAVAERNGHPEGKRDPHRPPATA